MKVSLVVTQGVHAGKTIPITSAQFLIGRDPHCNLRPQSQAISKQHAGFFVRDGKVFLKDYGSTNGSFVNGEQIVDEREVKNDDRLKIGPLEFTLHVEASPTPVAKPVAAKPAAAKPVAAKPVTAPVTSAPVKPIAAPVASATAKPVTVPVMPTPVPAAPETVGVAATTTIVETEEQSEDQLAAMLLMDDPPVVTDSTDRTAEQGIPDGTTVLEIPALPEDAKKAADLLQKVKEQSKNNSQAAGDLLRKYMNRPRSQ